MKTLQEFTIVFDHDELIHALAASLARQKTELEEESYEGEAVFEQDAVRGQQHQDG